MNFSLVFYTLGNYFLFYSICFLPSILISLLHQEWHMTYIFSATVMVTAFLGGILLFLNKRKGRLSYFTKKEGVLTVSFIWVFSGIIGGMPFYFSGEIQSLISSIFESVSGFTTTGASVLTDIEKLPKSLLFWRSFTHFLGGLGIVVLFVAILPYLGVGGKMLFKSEVPGPEAEMLRPKIQATAVVLLKIYLFFTVVQTLLLFLCGMELFDSLCHTFGTLATGGFSTKNASIAHYQDLKIELIIIFFMFLAGANFSLYFYFLEGNRRVFFQDDEFKAYLAFLLLAIAAITIHLNLNYRVDSLLNLREASFMVVSVHTTTGYGLGDYELWTPFSQLVLLTTMFIGGCAGSTGGGIKVIRWIIVFKYIFARMENITHPHAVIPVKINRKVLDDNVVRGVVGLFLLWLLIFGFVTLVISAMGLDIITSSTATLATLNNIGPGLGQVGPTDNFSSIPEFGKFLLTICMLLGRLEIYTMLILFMPSFWRR